MAIEEKGEKLKYERNQGVDERSERRRIEAGKQ